jgi:tyrosine-protein phosphatase
MDGVLVIYVVERRLCPLFRSCQCGISRSATLLIAYIMYLVHQDLVPEHCGHLKGKTMMEVYDWVKMKSRWIGPNVA